MKSPIFGLFWALFGLFWALFGHFSDSTSINDSLTIELNYLLNWITTIIFELNNCLNWILGNQYWIEYWIESNFAEIQTLNWIVLGIDHGYASHQMKVNPRPPAGLPSSSHIVPIGIVVKVAHRPSLAVVHSGLNTLNTLPSTSPPGWSPSGPDEKGHIAPHEPKRQPLIEVSADDWSCVSSFNPSSLKLLTHPA